MKLRMRSFESKETLKIEVPSSCTLSQLKQNLVQALPNSPSPDSIQLSLNRKDELKSVGEDPLHYLGIAAGDLIYFSLEQPAASSTAAMTSNSQSILPQVTRNSQSTLPQVTVSTSLNSENTLLGALNSNSDIFVMDRQKGESSDRVSQMEDTMEKMEAYDEDNNENSYETDGLSAYEVVENCFSVPGFLRKFFMEELGEDTGKDHKLIITAVHAVMLETGFLSFDKNADMVVNGLHFSNEWPPSLFRLSLYYTLQECLGCAHGEEAVKSVVLKFQSMGKFVNVYGTLENISGKKVTYRVQLDEDQLVPFLNVVWANCGVADNINGKNGGGLLSSTSPEKEVFNFWRNVKDNLALPLLIDLCEEFGLPLPPCFTRLPTDLKLKILEYLSGVDIAKTSCVCSELRYLGSSDDLWKMKFVEEFGDGRKEAQGSWKRMFAKDWGRMRKRRKANGGRRCPSWPAWRRYNNPFLFPRVPRITEGDFYTSDPWKMDRDFRGFGRISGPPRIFSPDCNL
ncbi:hypothetical protein OROHE_026429 [Orobanche hederae]